jgi:colanic acid/amylovoran biosynthesis glycosyltransferase
MVIMEAFALGRPVLSSYVAGIPELVIPGESGWLVPAGSREALTDAILAVMHASASELDAMAARGRAAVRRNHYTPTETAKLAQHFLEVTGAAPSRLEPAPEGAASSRPHARTDLGA